MAHVSIDGTSWQKDSLFCKRLLSMVPTDIPHMTSHLAPAFRPHSLPALPSGPSGTWHPAIRNSSRLLGSAVRDERQKALPRFTRWIGGGSTSLWSCDGKRQSTEGRKGRCWRCGDGWDGGRCGGELSLWMCSRYIYIYTYIYIYIYICVCVISTAADGTAAVLTKNLWAVTSHQTSHSNDLV